MKCSPELETWLCIWDGDSQSVWWPGCLWGNTDQDKDGALMGPHCLDLHTQAASLMPAPFLVPQLRHMFPASTSVLVRVFITDHHRWGGWHVFSHNSGSYKFKTTVLTNSVCGERSFCLVDNCLVAVCSHGLSSQGLCVGGRGAGERKSCLVSLLTRILILSD